MKKSLLVYWLIGFFSLNRGPREFGFTEKEKREKNNLENYQIETL